ncbi:murein DD-endopeptidase MepM/ murein hydrolase activator NlpD [Nocardioides luteus]|uniref:Peptidase n=1 Tax=Nocardioides luteus TaxID=1844 RepID=A0ABQ5SSY4_9ACTN|nr:M23 family metallopeptidase [Nocardioides luteus]MDR7309839.1 murein DD-endopeptidase MepM/ murein hydrolase activator NlpD [Nocardioides luteus]GLJ67252.1 peptidase [Nocardioides luteus]
MTSHRFSDRVRALVAALFLVVLIAPSDPALATPRAEVAPSGASLDGATGHDEGSRPVGATDEVPRGEWPLAPQPSVERRFDPPDAPWGAGHRGVDLAGSPGAVVRAALAGTVSFAGVIAGKPAVSVDHGATRTTYEPVVATVSVGDSVAAGSPLGRLGVAGSHCFPAACLHWGWIRNADDVYLDPLLLVDAPRPIRLLPLWRGDPVR